jgi:hypothetical protein
MALEPTSASERSLQEEIERGKYRERALEAALIRRLEDLAASEARIKSLQSSLSWRITRPLRLVARGLRRVKRLAKSLPKAS